MLHSITEQMWQNKKSMLSLHLLSSGFPNGNSEAKLSLWSRCVFVVMCSVRILRWLLLQKENVLHQRCKMCWKKDLKKKAWHMQQIFSIIVGREYQIMTFEKEVICLEPFAIKHILREHWKSHCCWTSVWKMVKRRVRGYSWLNEMLRYFFPIEVKFHFTCFSTQPSYTS